LLTLCSIEHTDKWAKQIELKATRRTEHIVGILESYLSVNTKIGTLERISDITNKLLKDIRLFKEAVHGPLGITYRPNEKAHVIADCLEIKFTSHDLCDENHERQVETTVRVLLASVDYMPLGKVRPCDIHKLANALKLRKACGLDGISNECLRHLPRRPLVHPTHLFNYFLRVSHFPKH
jgi:hypothetical protein